MAEQKIVMDFTEQEIFDLDAMATEGYRLLRDDATEQQRAAALAIVHRIDANRRALLAGERAPDATPPAPRVFFPGDTVPAGVALANQLDSVLTPQTVPYVITGGPSASYIELPIPSREEWQATVDRARAERGEQP